MENRCLYISNRVPFKVPDGTSFCIYYVVFCRNDVVCCPFNHRPHHEVRLREFEIYPANGFQLSLFDVLQ